MPMAAAAIAAPVEPAETIASVLHQSAPGRPLPGPRTQVSHESPWQGSSCISITSESMHYLEIGTGLDKHGSNNALVSNENDFETLLPPP